MEKSTVTTHGQVGASTDKPSNEDPCVGDDLTCDAEAKPATRSVTGNNAGASKNFEFVLVTDSGSRKQVRRHAMRQYVHQRRLDGIARLESTRVQISGWSTGNTGNPSDETSPSTKVEELDDNEDSRDIGRNHIGESKHYLHSSGRKFRTGKKSGAVISPKCRDISTTSRFKHDFGPLDPKPEPGSGTLDPFDSYPLALKRADHDLIDHFVTKYPLMMYQMEDARQYNPIRGIFHQLALHDPVPFQAMLAVAAKHRAGVEGQIDTVQSLTHKTRAIKLIQERLKNDTLGKQDGTLYAAASMAVIEKWSKDARIERMHFQGVRQMVRRRGGMRAMRTMSPTSSFMEKVLYWVEFSCAPNAIIGASLPWTGDIPDVPPASLPFMSPKLRASMETGIPAGKDADGIPDILQSCEDFLTFFRSLNDLEQLLLSRRVTSSLGHTELDGQLQPHQPTPFDTSSPLYNIITTLPDYDHGIRDVRFIDEYTCMACLLYLNVALYDYYLTSQDFDGYLEWVNWEIRKVNSRSNPSISSVLWIFLNNGGYPAGSEPDNGERNWFVSRMLRVAKRLEWKQGGILWDQLRSTLFQFLVTQRECGIGSHCIDEESLTARENKTSNPRTVIWDEEDMRRNILGKLYSGPPIFAASSEQDSLDHLHGS